MASQIIRELVQNLEAQLPGAAARIRRTRNHTALHDMLLEYEEGVKAIRRWRSVSGDSDRIGELTQLIDDLQQEILRFLSEQTEPWNDAAS